MRHAPGADILMRCTANAIESAMSDFCIAYIGESDNVGRRRASSRSHNAWLS
ncbi:hypothetical protein HNQ36_002895 [Afipia massiliensis]|jgi:hypothetical protein|uniref:Uncharacterized protein n=1 Tax=Afipia massiliensis TaxID=211460 RepID=A0A840N2Q6_9BRAD|nr:hypothetical protein [Afipia massiliensis]